MTELIGQIFGILVMLGCIVTNQFPKRWQMLLGFAVINLFSALNQLLVGAGLTASFVALVAVVHCPINAYKSYRNRPARRWEDVLFSVLYFGAWGVGFVVSLRSGSASWMDLMPLLATVCFVGSVFLPKERDIRLCTFANSAIYFVYDIINLNLAATAKLFNMISVVVALVRYREKRN
jgi:nucleoside recognition membrane protein YjiH